MLIDDAVRAYLDDKARRLRGNTIEGYVSALRRYQLRIWDVTASVDVLCAAPL